MNVTLAACGLGMLGTLGTMGCTRKREPAAAGSYPGAAAAHARFNAQVAEQLDAELQFSPTLATWLGDHTSDDRLDDVRLEAALREVVRLENLLDRVRRENDSWQTAPPDAAVSTPAETAAVGDGGVTDAAESGGAVTLAAARKPEAPAVADLGVTTHDAVALLATLPAEPMAGHEADGQRLDRILLQARIEARRFELTELRPHEKNPLFYANLMAFGLDSLLGPSLATPAGLRALRGRLADIPTLCREAQRNLKNPPEIWTRRAADVNQMTRDFVAGLLPRILANLNLNLNLDPKLQEEVNHQRDEAQRALEDFGGWLSRELLPRSKGDWALPADRLLSRLRATELLDVPLDIVQDRAEFEHREARRHLEELAKRLTGISSAARAVTEALHLIEEDHPRAEELRSAVDAALDKAYELSAGLLTVPQQRPQIVEMPAYRFGYLQLMLPAPLEADRTAQLLFDPVDPSWKDKKRVSDHLRMLNRSQLLLTMAHDVMPGRFAQQQAQTAYAAQLSPLRQRTRSLALLEGWAGYAEQLVVLGGGPGSGQVQVQGPMPGLVQGAPTGTGTAGGIPGGTPGALGVGSLAGPANDRLQIFVLRQQLLRLGRLLVALHLHAPQSGSPVASARLEAAEDFFTAECFLDEYAARREVERATYDPLYGAAALGRLQLLQLRADYQAEHHDDFTLKGFHDALLAQGALPVVALRQLLLRQRGPSLRPPPEPDPSQPPPE